MAKTMYLIERLYVITHHGGGVKVPYQYTYPLCHYIMAPIRKYMCVVVIPSIPFNGLRVLLYKMIGFKIGKGCFIGMRCYLDDYCYKDIEIGNNWYEAK